MSLTPDEWSTLSLLLGKLGVDCHDRAAANGFWQHRKPSVLRPSESETLEIAAKIALIANEAGELLEAWRLVDPFGPCPKDPVNLTHFGEEGADVLIRLVDLYAHFGIDLAADVKHKLAVNGKRAYKHGKRF